LNAIHTAPPIAPAEDTSAPVQETQAVASAGNSRGVITDMVQVATPPPPVESSATAAAPAPALVAAANPAGATDDAGLVPTDGLVLTVTARDSCSMRLQIDADARHAQRYRFAHVGETRSWSARRSFRVVAQRAAHLEVRLNGKLVRVPEGRTLVLDRSTLEPAAARPARRPRKPRSTRVAPAPAPATATSPAALTPVELPRHHSSGPPPR
jgi:hypothetical protein